MIANVADEMKALIELGVEPSQALEVIARIHGMNWYSNYFPFPLFLQSPGS